MLIDYAGMKGYHVVHFSQFPSNDPESIGLALPHTPLLAILDINMPEVDGYQVCKYLRENLLPTDIPIIFTSGLIESDDVLKAYEAGGNDYLTKPVRLPELSAKIAQIEQENQQKIILKEELESAQNMAFQAMSSSAELGAIIHFHEQCMQIKDETEMAQQLLALCNQFGLKCSVLLDGQSQSQLKAEQAIFISDSCHPSNLEHKTISILRAQSRIYSWDCRTIFNYQDIALLVRNMPINDEARFGELKDLVCLILNGVQSRLEAMKIEHIERQQRLCIAQTVKSITELVTTMDQRRLDLSAQFEKTITNMETQIAGDILQFNLLENEEAILLTNVQEAITQASKIFDESAADEKHYKKQLENLVSNL